MVTKSWFVPGTILVIILMIGGAIYVGSKTETVPTPTPTTPTITTPTPTVSTPPPLNDTDAINQLISRYHEAVRTKSLNDLMMLFTDDATLHGPTRENLSGKNQIGGYFSNVFDREKESIDLQVIESSTSIEGPRATVRTKVVSNEKFGTEFFELTKFKGIWKISSLTLFSL